MFSKLFAFCLWEGVGLGAGDSSGVHAGGVQAGSDLEGVHAGGVQAGSDFLDVVAGGFHSSLGGVHSGLGGVHSGLGGSGFGSGFHSFWLPPPPPDPSANSQVTSIMPTPRSAKAEKSSGVMSICRQASFKVSRYNH